jgi:glutamate/tyrosine decarboxylase-like PLP-dependent enzyme
MSNELRAVLETALGHAVAYRSSLDARPVAPSLDYHAMRDRVAQPLPEHGIDAEAMLAELVDLADPGLMSSAGPRFFGWVIGSSALPAVAADWLVSAWGQNAGFQATTPAMAAIEETVEKWLVDILDLPPRASVGVATGATVANATCLAAARGEVLRRVGWDVEADGLFGAPPVEVLIGEDAHSSLFSSLQLIGFGYKRVTRIASDAQGRMRADALAEALGRGGGPRIVIAQAGQINTGAFDPFADIAAACAAAGAWLHVDGAFGLWARASPVHKHLTAGIEAADSWVTDGHKWLQVPYDCGFAIVKDREAHQRAMMQWSSYLPSIATGDRIPSGFVPELSRRARATPVWAILKTLGRNGVAALVERVCAEARQFAARLAAEPGISVLNEVVHNQVIVEFGAGDAAERRLLTAQVIAGVQAEGTCFAAGAEWHGHWVMRLSISGGETTPSDIDRSADAIIGVWRQLRG